MTNHFIFGQTIVGKIVDKYQQPIQEANILNKNTDHHTHTHTNELGEFTLENTSIGDTLQISMLGYKTKLIGIQNLTDVLEITLNEKVITLNPEGILIDDAYYELAELYTRLNNIEKASEYYQKIIFEQASSIYLVDARKKYRKLRGDNL